MNFERIYAFMILLSALIPIAMANVAGFEVRIIVMEKGLELKTDK